MASPVERERDWASQAADTIESVVDSIAGKTTKPLTLIARALVYGLLGMVLVVAAVVLFAAGMVRLVDVYLPGEVWSAHLLVGGLFTLGGLFLWRKGRMPQPSAG